MRDRLTRRLEREGLETATSEFWAYARPARSGHPDQGFKIHVSATPANVDSVLDAALGVLAATDTPFKVVRDLDTLRRLNAGTLGYSQIGKVLTVYPSTTDEAVSLGLRLVEATRGLRGPRVPTDRAIDDRGIVSYRWAVDRGAERIERRPGDAVPSEVPDPFRDPYDPPPSKRQLLAGRFVVLRLLRLRGRGAVFEAIDLGWQRPRRVVVKQALRDGETDERGTDAVARLRWEHKLLCELATQQLAPAALDFVGHGDDAYLILEHLDGITVREFLTQSPAIPFIIDFLVQLCEQVAKVHSAGIVLRDLSPDNALLGTLNRVWLLDFEYAHRRDGPPLTPTGTKGFTAPQLLRRSLGREPSARDDVYSLARIGGQLVARSGGPRPIQRELRSILRRASSHDARRRPRTILHLREQLIAAKGQLLAP